jgi:hypothetical protein
MMAKHGKTKTRSRATPATCEADYQTWGKACGKPAVTFHKTWRFGQKAKGEKPIVHMRMGLCRPCATIYDQLVAEGRAEARIS